MPGSAIGIIIVVKAPQIDKPSTNAASSSSVGIELNWSRIIHITMGKTVRYIVELTRCAYPRDLAIYTEPKRQS